MISSQFRAQQSSSVHPVITYSPAYTLVPTYECFNRCSYCNFRSEVGQGQGLALDQARAQLQALTGQGVIEILLLSGEVHPDSPRRAEWFARIYQLCELALELGFLPHTNAGILTYEEMRQLQRVNVSMGLMLEQLCELPVHAHAPSKAPGLRLQQLAWAGELGIPFTTGLLVGIGETLGDRLQTLGAIAQMYQQFGHIQEVILQPYRPGNLDEWQQSAIATDGSERITPDTFLELVQVAREILPPPITLQIPPNLLSATQLLTCLELGVRDLGGIGPKDEVNPDYPHPKIGAEAGAEQLDLTTFLATAGWELRPRLPVYPQFDRWLNQPLQHRVQSWRQHLTALQQDKSSDPVESFTRRPPAPGPAA